MQLLVQALVRVLVQALPQLFQAGGDASAASAGDAPTERVASSETSTRAAAGAPEGLSPGSTIVNGNPVRKNKIKYAGMLA